MEQSPTGPTARGAAITGDGDGARSLIASDAASS